MAPASADEETETAPELGEDLPAEDEAALSEAEDEDVGVEPLHQAQAAAAPPAVPFVPTQQAAATFPGMMIPGMPSAAPYYPAAPGWPPPMPYAVLGQPGQAQQMPAAAVMPPGVAAPPFAPFANQMMAATPMAAAQGGAAMMPAIATMGAYPMMAVPGGIPPMAQATAVPQAAATAPHAFVAQELAVPANFSLNSLAGGGDVNTPPDESSREFLSDKEKKKRRKKRKDKPKRPLSTYNLFFKDERSNILAGILDKGEENAATKQGVKDRAEKEKAGPPPPDVDSDSGAAEDEENDETQTSQPCASAKRKTPHGKIGFESLAKTIGARWKELSSDRLEHYKKLADEDSERYAREMEEFNKKVESEKEAALTGGGENGAVGVSVGSMDLASAIDAARGAREEAQRIADSVGIGLMITPAATSSSGSSAAAASASPGEGKQPPAKKKRGRRPRDSLLDPEALAAWTQQCQQAVTGANAAAAAAEAARQAQQALFFQATGGSAAGHPQLAQVPAAVPQPPAAMMMPATAAPGAPAMMMPAGTPGAPAMMMVPGAMAMAVPMQPGMAMQPGAMAMPYPAWPMMPNGISPHGSSATGNAGNAYCGRQQWGK